MARERALRFRGRLSAKDAPDVVLERVQALRRELAATEQDTLDTKHLDPYCDALKKSEFLQHPRAAVRASVACCLSDMLRLYAPNAPFSEAEIAQIFAQFLAQLTEPGSSLADRDAELYADKVYVLQSLSTVKSVALVCDVHGASKLISSYFAQLMALGAHELATNVELYVVDVLVQLVEESASLPRAAIDTLLAAFDDDAPPAQHRIAVAVCRATEDRLQKHVAQALSASIRGAAQRDARAAVHARIVRIAASVASLLTSVVPQLEAELASDDAEVRQLATRVLASLFALDRASFAAQYASAWRAWKGRAVDRHAGVRADWVDGAWAVVTHHASLAAELGEALGRRASDPEERVRVAVARGARALDYETLRHHVPRVVLEQLAQRGKDKRAAVREAALDAVGHAYALAYPELRRDPGATEHFSWIPRAVLPCALAGTGDVVHSVAQTLDTHLVPFDEPDAYAARLVYVYRTLDDEARAALYYFTNLRLARPTACDAFLAAWADGDVRDVVRPVCALLRTDAAADLEALGAWRSDAAQAHARTAFDAHTSAADAHAACAAALELVRAHDAALEPTCAAFLRAGSYPVLNTSLVLPLLDAGDDAAPLRTYLARDAPQLLAPHAAALAARTQAGSVAALELLAALAAHTHVDVPDALRDALRAWCDDERDAYDATATPLAAQVLACTHDPALTHVVHALESRAALGTVDDQAAAYAALGAVAAHAPDAVALDALAEQITALLRAPWAAPDAPAWHATPPALHVRLAALAALARVCAAAHDAARARPVVQLLLHIAQRGEPRADVQTPPRAAARLRLAAAEELVRLAETDAYAPLVGARLARLAHVLQDEAFEVRAGFLHTLLAARTRGAVPAAFEAALYLVALDPEDEVRARVAAYARRAAAQGAAPDAQAARLLHLLAHHPDLATDDDEALVSFGTYVAFFAACVATQDNVAALVHVARAVHHAADATDARTSDALSLVGAIAERVLQHTADTHGWAVRPLADAEAAAHTLPPELFAARTAPAPTLPARAAERLVHGEVRAPLTDPGPAAQAAREARKTSLEYIDLHGAPATPHEPSGRRRFGAAPLVARRAVLALRRRTQHGRHRRRRAGRQGRWAGRRRGRAHRRGRRGHGRGHGRRRHRLVRKLVRQRGRRGRRRRRRRPCAARRRRARQRRRGGRRRAHRPPALVHGVRPHRHTRRVRRRLGDDHRANRLGGRKRRAHRRRRTTARRRQAHGRRRRRRRRRGRPCDTRLARHRRRARRRRRMQHTRRAHRLGARRHRAVGRDGRRRRRRAVGRRRRLRRLPP